MNRYYQMTGVVLVLAGAFFGLNTLELSFFTDEGPGPGFLPLSISIGVGLLGAIMYFQARRSPFEPVPANFIAPKSGYYRMGVILLSLVVVAAVFETAGYRLTMFCYTFVNVAALERANVIIAVLMALVASVGVFYGASLLGIALPIGVLGF